MTVFSRKAGRLNRRILCPVFTVAMIGVTPVAASAQIADSKAVHATDTAGEDRKLKLSGSFRVRYEALGGQPRPQLDARDSLIAVRATLAAQYDNGLLSFGAEIYDSRVYGADAGTSLTTGEVNTVELVQAHVTANLDEALGSGSQSRVQLGRMMLNIGSRRLIAADDYRNTTNGYTGLRFDYERKGLSFLGLYVLPQIRRPDDFASLQDNKGKSDRETFNLQLWAGVLGYKFLSSRTVMEAAYYGLNERDEPSHGRATRDRKLHTVGGRVIRDAKPGSFDYELEGFYQFGTISASTAADAPKLDVGAYFLHVDVGYQFEGGWRPRLSIEYDYASGDGRGKKFTRFDTLFGMRRGDFQPSGIIAAIGRANINTPGVRLEVMPSSATDAFLSYRPMWLASHYDSFATTTLRDATGRSGSFAGHQIDARIRHWLLKDYLRLEMNGVYIAKGRFMLEAPNAPDTGDTRYISVAVLAQF